MVGHAFSARKVFVTVSIRLVAGRCARTEGRAAPGDTDGCRMRLRWSHVLIVIAAWTVVAVLFTPQMYVINQRAPVPPSWWQAFVINGTTFYAWAVLTPLVLWFVRRCPVERERIWMTLAAHLAAAVVVAGLHLLIVQGVQVVLSGGERPRPLSALWIGYGATNVLVYGLVAACAHALSYYTRYQEREFRLAQAQLHMLRAQLHPHFLFNTINAIAELIHLDPARAEQTLTQLSDLLRRSTSEASTHEVSLEEELDWLRQYLLIYETLLQDRLSVTWAVDDALRSARVPAMVLQPLVENAIRHGLAPRAAGGHVTIRAHRAADRLVLTVEDDGVGFSSGAQPAGVGLANIRGRLQSLHGEAASLTVAAAAGGGVTATLDLPWTVEP